jgi:hypothetical protein
MARWKRISAMISVQNHAFLVERMKSIHAGSMGEALDHAISQVRRAHGWVCLERETAASYANMTPEEIAEENELAAALTRTVRADCEEADKS